MARGAKGIAPGWRLAALAVAGGAGTLVLADWLATRAAGKAQSILPGDQGRFVWQHGEIAYTVRGRGEPLVLLHGVYAGASSFEYRRVFEQLAQHHRVFAVDLLGFGLSQRPQLVYTPDLYVRLIQDFVRQVVGGADHPVSLVASTLGAAFAIHAVDESPDLFRRLLLIEPVGIEQLAKRPPEVLRRLLLGLLRSPVVGQGLYNLIVSRAGLRYFLRRQVYPDPRAVTDDLLDQYYTLAHQPGARFAPASFLSGTLNTPVAQAFARLRLPILLLWGKDAAVTPLIYARAFRQANPSVDLRVLDCGALPQDEVPDEFVREVTAWLGAGSRHGR